MDALLQPWVEAVGDTASSRAAGRDVVARYAEPHRRYHDRRHLAEVLEALRTLTEGPPPVAAAACGGPGARALQAPPATVVLASYFHDAVYDGEPGQDEARSAELAVTVLNGLGRPTPEVEEVVRLVLLTAGHDPRGDDEPGALLCDADLAVLGATPERYRDYAADVRREYAHVPDEAFRAGRAAVLRALAARRPLFTTARAQERWEEAARRNLQDELARLAAGPPPGADPPARAR